MLKLEPMTPAQLRESWDEIGRAFPENERKPLAVLEEHIQRGVYDIWWLTEDGERKGCAMLLCVGRGMALLDYLMMLEQGKGYGTACLELLKARYRWGLLVEAEAITAGLDPEEAQVRRRRQAFYRRCGFVPCGWRALVCGVEYQIFGWFARPPADWSRRCQGEYCRLYRTQTPEGWMREHFALV